MDWRIKASLQKILATGSLGDKLNHLPVTLNKEYHQNVFLYQTHECLRKFDYYSGSLENATALEIGTGYSILSSIVLALLGFQKVVTVDVTKDVRFATFKKQIPLIDSPEFLVSLAAKSVFSKEELEYKCGSVKTMTSLDEVFDYLNIIYIAPYTFNDIDQVSSKFDYVCSQVVLEHMHPDILEELFKRTQLWLTIDGCAVHTINFIDHFANDGFFQDKSISEFNFLRYSDAYWSFWSGNSIAYVNRLSYVYYLELGKKYDLEIVDFVGENYRKRVELDQSLIHSDIYKKYFAAINPEELMKFQRGTLVVKKG